MRLAILVGVTLGLCGPSGASASRNIFTPVRDATLYEPATGEVASGAGPALFVGSTGGLKKRRALLKFDVTSIPSGAHIDSVTLLIRITRTADTTPRDFALHRVLADWGEGSSNAGGDSTGAGGGGGAPVAIGDASWNYRFFDTDTWTHPGGDFDPAVLSTTSLGTIGVATWHSTSALVAAVQAWVDGTASNFGWLLSGSEDQSQSSRRFGSRESTNVDERPQLLVDYTPTAVRSTTWATIKSSYR